MIRAIKNSGSISKDTHLPYIICSVIFAVGCAVAGWEKLKYGLSFIDEGMYLTDAWRLANGDRLFPDSNRLAASFYNIFSFPLFLLDNNLSILGVRKIQFLTNSILLLIVIIRISSIKPDALPFLIFLAGPFFFTGLDPVGMSSAFNYYTVPAAFLFCHLVAFSFAANAKESKKNYAFLFLSGLCITAVGIAYLPAGLAGAGVALYVLLSQKKNKLFRLVVYVAPAPLYLALVHPHYTEHFSNLNNILTLNSTQGAPKIYPHTPFYLLASAFVFFAASLILLLKRPATRLAFTFAASVTLYIAIDTQGFGILPEAWNGIFNRQAFAAGLTIAAALFSFFIMGKVSLTSPKRSKTDLVILTSTITFLIYGTTLTITSTLGSLLFLSGSFSAWLLLFASFIRAGADRTSTVMFIGAIFLPTSLHLMQADWDFTYFDKSPSFLDTKIESGPAQGIYTNPLNASIEKSVRELVERKTGKQSYILAFDQAPMTYFLTRRLPALDHSWVGITQGNEYLMKDAIGKMVQYERIPSLAIHWRNRFLWTPLAPDYSEFALSGFSDSREGPLLDFVRTNYRLTGEIKVDEKSAIQFFEREPQAKD